MTINNTQEILFKLFKIATNQQKILQKLAQSNPELHKNPYNPSDPAYYGKLDPNDPRQHDPLYGGEEAPEETEKKQQAPQTPPVQTNNLQPPQKPANWLDKYFKEQEQKNS